MLYKKSLTNKLDNELFVNPTSEYRAAPFWAWNCKLNREQLFKQIRQLKKMGMGGFHIHCRIGLDTEYLGDEYFSIVEDCKNEAKKQNMLCWLYDEDRWPSGTAGGFVTEDLVHRLRFLVFVPGDYIEPKTIETFTATAQAVRSSQRKLLGTYKIELDKDGTLLSYNKVDDNTVSDKDIWKAYLEISGDTPWFNNQSYVNTLDEKAINRFIEITHEKYYELLMDDFGETIPAIFTDEPQTSHKEVLSNPFERKPILLPFTDDFEHTYKARFGVSILEHLPELFWEKNNETVSKIRYYYHMHICERFSEAFCDNIGKWCDKHNIYLTGHMMNEWTLYSQTSALGEVMRPLKYFGLPGVDMLCDRRELSTLKQAQSVAHQYGREGVMSELYGVTSWAFDFRNHKLQGDWQAALGVTVRVPHLTWVSMEGEAKRDYPASIGYQSPWYKEYSYIEDHFARLNTVLTRGTPHVRVGVIHPIESYWLYWGNQQQTAGIRQDIETNFKNIIDWLLYGLIDFDFISESLLSEDKSDDVSNQKFIMGEMKYDIIIVPECHTIRRTTLKKLRVFQENGGHVVFAGRIPKYVDAKESMEAAVLAESCNCIPYSNASLMKTLEPYRDVDVYVRAMDGVDLTRIEQSERGTRANNLFYQMRIDGDKKWLFICHVNKPENEHITHTEEWKINIKGDYSATVYDTLKGETYNIQSKYKNNKTEITYYCSQHDSLLMCLEDKKSKNQKTEYNVMSFVEPLNKKYLSQPCNYSLEEDNVYLLDIAKYSFNDQEWNEEEEILRIDNLFRQKLGFPLRMEALAQPWTIKEEEVVNNKLCLQFSIFSEIEVEQPVLAMENPYNVIIKLNNELINNNIIGWYVDESIKKIQLPNIQIGMNILEIEMPYGSKTNVEWMYLLGDFGVNVAGRYKKIVKLPDNIWYGDFTKQGLPFYAGNLEYEIPFTSTGGSLCIEISHYKGALIKVAIDDEAKGIIALAPYQLDCGYVSPGEHIIKIKVFGNRINAFGAVHNADNTEEWYGPNIWRTENNKWSYEYQLNEMGILTTPRYWMN